MSSAHTIEALACTAQLALALVAISRGPGSSLSRPLALLCLDLFTWNSADLAHDLTGQIGWHWLDVSASPLTAPLALDFILAFTGQRRELSSVRKVCWAIFGLLSLSSALAFFWPAMRAFAGSDLWAALHVGAAIPATLFAAWLTVVHLRRADDAEEKARAWLLVLGLATGALGTTDLLAHFFPRLPNLAPIGLLLTTTLLTIATARLRLLDTQFASANARRRSSAAQLTLLGRFSAQMAHDLKNPLAALKGAAQYLQEQLRREGAPAERQEFVQLILDQALRVEGVVEHYQRLSSMEAVRAPLNLNQLVNEVLALQSFAAGKKINVRAELATALPEISADRSLIAEALENLLANAFEAIDSDGVVTVRTEAAPGGLFLSIEDDGPGMDARTREQAFDDFFTTKATGSGLGLAFVRRTAEAHRGTAKLSARSGRGTVVRLRFPAAGTP